MNKNIFDINHNKLVYWLIPALQQKANTYAWLKALVKPVLTLYQAFLRYRKQKLYELAITPQVVYLEKLLNDKYDFVDRRIRIADAIDRLPVVFYLEEELKPVVFYTEGEGDYMVFYTEGEAGLLKDDFVILVPLAISFNDNEMSALIKGYKLAGTKFKIQRI